jgi:hypothetical protein
MAKHDAMRSALVVVGNSQAEVMARVLRGVDRVTNRLRVEFVEGGQALASSYEPGSLLLEQMPFESSPVPPGIARRAAFPNLTCGMLWPLAAPNPLNHPDPDFPNGPFPYADAFLQACILAGTPRPQMLRLYFQAVWSDSWPDLDEVLRAESGRLLDLDRASGLHIGSFVLSEFREKRLFLNPDAQPDDGPLAKGRAGRETEHVAVPRERFGDLVLPVQSVLELHRPVRIAGRRAELPRIGDRHGRETPVRTCSMYRP